MSEDYVAREEARLLKTMAHAGKAPARPRSWSMNKEAQEFKVVSDQIHKTEEKPHATPIHFGASVHSPTVNNHHRAPSPVFNFEPVRRQSPAPSPVHRGESPRELEPVNHVDPVQPEILSEKTPSKEQDIVLSKEAEERQAKAEFERFSRYLGRTSHTRKDSNSPAGTPTVHSPATNSPVVQRADSHSPATNSPVAQRPDLHSPATNSPVVQRPDLHSPATNSPVVQRPDLHSPATNSPVVHRPDSHSGAVPNQEPSSPVVVQKDSNSPTTQRPLQKSDSSPSLPRQGSASLQSVSTPTYRRQGSNSFSFHTRQNSEDKNSPAYPRKDFNSPTVRKEAPSPRFDSIPKPLSIDKSPRQAVMLEISGNGSTKGEAGKSTSFVIKTKAVNIDSGKTNVVISVKITAKNIEGKVVEIPNNVHIEGDGHHVTYTPAYIGAHTVEIYVGSHLAHTLTVPVYEGGPYALNTDATYFTLKNAMVGNKAQLIVTPMSYIKRLVPLGYSSLAATVAHVDSNTSIKNVSVLGNKEGHYVVSFYPAQTGDHIISVTLNGQHISGSPFVFNVIG